MRETDTRRNRSTPPRRRAVGLATLSALVFALGLGPARSADTEVFERVPVPVVAMDGPTFAQRFQAAYWRDRTCSTPACRSARPSTLTEVASFGFAAFGGAWLCRRRMRAR